MFLQKARKGNNAFWTYLVTIIMVIMGSLIGQIPIGILALMSAANSGLSEWETNEALSTLDFEALGIDSNLGLFLVLLSFVFALAFLWFFVEKIHQKSFVDIITSSSRVRWSRVLFGFLLWMGLTIVGEVVLYLVEPDNYTFHFHGVRFFILLAIALFILPLQTSFEEIFFRGYLMQGFSLISKYRFIPLSITSVLFGTLHFMNPEVEQFGFGIMMVYYIGIGLFLGVITLIDDGLELALGIHAATNIYGAVMVTFDASALQTLALFSVAEYHAPLMLGLSFLFMLVFMWVCGRRYGWKDWTCVYGSVERAEEEEMA